MLPLSAAPVPVGFLAYFLLPDMGYLTNFMKRLTF